MSVESIEIIISQVDKEGSFSDVYLDYYTKYRYTKITYFPTWKVFFLYINRDFIAMDKDVYTLLNMVKGVKEG